MKKNVFFVILCGLMLFSKVSASSGVTVSNDAISLDYEAKEGTICSVTAVADDYTSAEINAEKPTKLYYQGEITADENNICRVTFSMGKEALSGKYLLRILPEGGIVEEFEFEYISLYEKTVIINSLNGKTESEIKAILSSNEKLLGFARDEQSVIDINAVYNRIAKKVVSGTMFTPYTLDMAFDEAYVLEAIAQGDTQYMLDGGKLAHNNITKLSDSAAYRFYNESMSTDGINKVHSAIFGKSFNDIASLTDAFNVNSALCALYCNKAGGYGHVENVIAALRSILTDKLNVSLSSYDRLSSKEQFARRLMMQTVSNPNGLATAFAASLNTEGISGGGGSGGGSPQKAQGFSVSNSAGAVTPPEETVTEAFGDLSSVPWAVDNINYLAELKIINGRQNGSFAPNDIVTREEFVKMLVTAFGSNKKSQKKFIDVDENKWYYSYVSIGVGEGIVNGYEDDSFGIGKAITRQDMAVMAYRALLKTGKTLSENKGTTFADNQNISDYAKDAVYIMKSSGIINGKGENRFMPLEFCTRAEAAMVIGSLLKN